jgi:chemotaxis protein methyltransferase CheR
MLDVTNHIDLSDETFHLFRDLMYDQSGVVLNEGSKYFVENRLQQSVKRRQFKNFMDYYYYLRYDRRKDEELASLVDLLAIHETYFFREDKQLKTFSDEILPEICKRKSDDRTMRIWSAGCSTGEEPYTLSILLHEAKELRGWKIEIIATDISQRVLFSARRGLYQPSAFRSMDTRYISRYFRKEQDGFRIIDDIKQNVNFLHMNLLDENKVVLVNPVDVVLCRNVIIYFDTHAKKQVIATFYRKLKPEGFLLLGHSESLINISAAFAIRHFKHDLVYQKAVGMGRAA